MIKVTVKGVYKPKPPQEFTISGLSRDVMLGLRRLLEDTTGELGYELYDSVDNALTDDEGNDAADEAEKRFPDLKGTGEF